MRRFKIGNTIIDENETTAEMTNEQFCDSLRFTHPEAANATIRVNEPDADGNVIIDLLPTAQRKG